ncbi:polyprenyl synthetase family protein [Archangium sp.]|uniref:polyprenyl synthetase family protein n=1 Tax=Archangium sp. TaxID=1872627 RepID=UPI002D3798B8|nr:polyprenyl synthetase family protein [Archangium sp.]HYO53287.1 polyprenyl synthetase family protein [Archangium sp.]
MRERQQLVTRALEELFPPGPSSLIAAIREALLANGKRLRPILCIEACECVGGSVAAVLPAACAIEMIHKMTLVHDDLPSMDNAAMRDGRPALYRVHGEAMAILAGDTLLVHAFGQLASTRGAPSERILNAISRLCRALGIGGVAGGQALDILAQGESLSPETLENVHMRKTGALFEAAIRIGAEVGGASPAQMEALSHYGMLLGRAFQISDDIHDSKSGGTALGRDEATNYVQMLGREGAILKLRELVEQAISSLTTIRGGDIRPLAGIATFVFQRAIGIGPGHAHAEDT